MMEIRLTDNVEVKLIDVLLDSLSSAEEARIAVAFLKNSGLDLVEGELIQCLRRGGFVEFLIGLDFRITDADALLRLKKIGAKVYCYSNPFTDDTPVYHPKLYIFKEEAKALVAIGSSNLTEGGLKDNVEINAILTLSDGDELLSDIYALYNRLKFQPNRFEPDLDFIEVYNEVSARLRASEKSVRSKRSVSELVLKLRKREEKLPKPRVTPGDLFGWQKIVFERLPNGQFKTSDIYKFEDEFRRYYPENRNIRAKIRQILQQLRDLGLIKHVSWETWVK
jgi:HKD family nuclease